ncbi:MAG: hypothetical protein AAB227_11475, partial [Pseudomonadota bacterium]
MSFFLLPEIAEQQLVSRRLKYVSLFHGEEHGYGQSEKSRQTGREKNGEEDGQKGREKGREAGCEKSQAHQAQGQSESGLRS